MKTKKVTPITLQQMKEAGDKTTFVVVYDYPFAKILDECGVDIFLVGDSLATVALGKKDDNFATMDEMIIHTQAVARAAERAMVIADMPFMSYQVSIEEAIRNAGRLMKEGEADAVKIEGGAERAETIRALVGAGIPVTTQIGLLGQELKLTGVYKVSGRTEEGKKKLIEDAKIVEEAGVFMVCMECVTVDVAREITQTVKVPTNGDGSGPYCDGSALNLYDILGITSRFEAKFVKRYVNLGDATTDAVKQFIREVKDMSFPDEEHSYH